jgi:glycosyltransferase involved in cell wall biosynthesis
MKISITVGGKFCAFILAKHLADRGHLEQIITSYPKYLVSRDGVPRGKVTSVITKEVLERTWKHMPGFLRHSFNPQYAIHMLYDILASYRVRQTDLLIGWANYSSITLGRAKKRGIPTALTVGNSHISYQSRILDEEYRKFSIAFSGHRPHPKLVPKSLKEYEMADHIFVNSLFVKHSFIEEGVPESKLVHVPEGVDLSQFRQVPKSDDVFRIVFAGGLSLRKGTHYLLQAFSELNLKNAELVFLGVVNDEIKPFLKKYANDRVKCLGHVPQAELYKQYSEGSVLVLPSVEDGFGLVILQAMACGLPVIASENTGALDLIRDGEDGFIIPIRNVEALKEKILYFYENPEKAREMGASGKERASHGFTWDDYGANMVRALERIVLKK